jgi:CTP synthase
MYNVPLHFMEQGFDKLLMQDLGLRPRKRNGPKFEEWSRNVGRIMKPKGEIEIAIVGKYTKLHDAYVSVKEALVHAGAALDTGVRVRWVESEDLEKGSVVEQLKGVSGVLVPGGFGQRGTEGKISAINYARENGIPYLGLCLGMQLMVVEFARNVCGLEGANSTEFNRKTRYNVIDLLPSQRGVKQKGASMRLGAWKCRIIKKDSIAYRAYKKGVVSERHRHRYELNNRYRRTLERNGLVVSGVTPDNRLVEFTEWKNGFGIGTQAHPELKSKFGNPAPLFVSFLKASRDYSSAHE